VATACGRDDIALPAAARHASDGAASVIRRRDDAVIYLATAFDRRRRSSEARSFWGYGAAGRRRRGYELDDVDEIIARRAAGALQARFRRTAASKPLLAAGAAYRKTKCSAPRGAI